MGNVEDVINEMTNSITKLKEVDKKLQEESFFQGVYTACDSIIDMIRDIDIDEDTCYELIENIRKIHRNIINNQLKK